MTALAVVLSVDVPTWLFWIVGGLAVAVVLAFAVFGVIAARAIRGLR